MVLDSKRLTPNYALRDSIKEFGERFSKQIDSRHISILEEIGRGSSKIVYRAELRVPGSPGATVVAAAKVLATALGAEADILLGLGRHPNLVRFIGMYRADPDVMLITEFAPLGSLDNLLRDDDVEDSITPEHRHIIVLQVCCSVCCCAA